MVIDFSWSKECVISEIPIIPRIPGNPDVNQPVQEMPTIQTTAGTFQINNVPAVTLSINNNIKILENIKQGFKKIIYWNKYRSEITAQIKKNDLDYLIDPAFRNINRLFVLSFKNGNSNLTRDFFDKYHMPLVEIKDFNALTDSKLFFDQRVKNKQEAYKKLIEMSRGDGYTTGNLLDFSYHQNYYKLIGTDLSRQANMNIP